MPKVPPSPDMQRIFPYLTLLEGPGGIISPVCERKTDINTRFCEQIHLKFNVTLVEGQAAEIRPEPTQGCVGCRRVTIS